MTDTQAPAPDPKMASHVIEIWKTTVQVQQHFNDIELRLRNVAVTLLVAVLGGAGLAVKERVPVTLLGFTTSLGSWVVVAGLVGWLAFYMMDRWWYHRLLLGSVNAGVYIENRWKGLLPEIQLTDAIGKASPFRLMGMRVRSSNRLDLFYLGIAGMLMLAGIAIHLSTSPALPTAVP